MDDYISRLSQDMTGKVFGDLTVVGFGENTGAQVVLLQTGGSASVFAGSAKLLMGEICEAVE